MKTETKAATEEKATDLKPIAEGVRSARTKLRALTNVSQDERQVINDQLSQVLDQFRDAGVTFEDELEVQQGEQPGAESHNAPLDPLNLPENQEKPNENEATSQQEKEAVDEKNDVDDDDADKRLDPAARPPAKGFENSNTAKNLKGKKR